jgi:hypothetical protein
MRLEGSEAEDPGESESLNRLTRRELTVCAKRNMSTVCVLEQTGESSPSKLMSLAQSSPPECKVRLLILRR